MGKKCKKKKTQWRRLSLNELQTNDSSSKRRQHRTSDHDGAVMMVNGDEECKQEMRHFSESGRPMTASAGPKNPPHQPYHGDYLPQEYQQPYVEYTDAYISYDGYYPVPPHGQDCYQNTEEFPNYGPNPGGGGGHIKRHYYDKRHMFNGHNGIPVHGYHYNNGRPHHMMPFNRERQRFFNNGFTGPQIPPFHHRGETFSGPPPNLQFVDRRRQNFRNNGKAPSAGHFGGNSSPSLKRRWSSNEDEYNRYNGVDNFYYSQCDGVSQYGENGTCGHDSGNGYEAGSSETQSEPEERLAQQLQQPVQNILIDNDQYTKIQTPRQEVIFKKNSSGTGSNSSNTNINGEVSNDSTSQSGQDQTVQSAETSSVKAESGNKKSHASNSKNKKNKGDTSSSGANKTESTNSSTSKRNKKNNNDKKSTEQTSTQSKKSEQNTKKTSIERTKNKKKKDSSQSRENQNSSSKTTNEKKSSNIDNSEADDKQIENSEDNHQKCSQSLKLGVDECFDESTESDEEGTSYKEELIHRQERYEDANLYSDCGTAASMTTPTEVPPLAGVIMQQCYPGGPLVSIPVHWSHYLDPNLVPGDTALTPLDPSFTHILDQSFKPLVPKSLNSELDDVDSSAAEDTTFIVPENVIPVQHDETGCPVTVQVKVDENCVPIQIEPSSIRVQLSTLQQQHHPTCQMSGVQFGGMPYPYGPYYVDAGQKSPHFDYNFDEGLEKRLEQKIDEELAKHYSDEEDEAVNGVASEEKSKPAKEETEYRDCELVSCDSQYASMSEGSSLPTSPAELSDCPTTCPPNTPSSTASHELTPPKILEEEELANSLVQEVCTSSSSSADTTSSSVSSSSTLCASSSSTTLVSYSPPSLADCNTSPYMEISPSSSLEQSSSSTLENDTTRFTVSDDDTNTSIITVVAVKESTEGSSEENCVDSKKHDDDNNAEDSVVPDDTASNLLTESDASAPVENISQEHVPENSEIDSDCSKVTIKSGYVIVPILTPYYDPNVLYGYSPMMPEVQPERVQPQHSGSSRKKKKKQNRRRAIAETGFVDAELYAGDPFIATPDGYLVPMDPLQVYHYQQQPIPYVPMQHYPQYQVVPPELYQPCGDEGFVSVEHTPFLPENIPEPDSCQNTFTKSRTNDDSKRFADLHEIEKKQIKEVLEDAPIPRSQEEDSGVSEVEEVSSSTQCPETDTADSNFTNSSNVSDNNSSSPEISDNNQCDINNQCNTKENIATNDEMINNSLPTNESQSSCNHSSGTLKDEKLEVLNEPLSSDLIKVGEVQESIQSSDASKNEVANVEETQSVDIKSVTSPKEAESIGTLALASHTAKALVRSRSSSSSDNLDDEEIAKLRNERECAQQLLVSRLTDSSSSANTSSEKQTPVTQFKDLKVTEAVRRWVREVTPDKAFFPSEDLLLSNHVLSDEEFSGSDGEYFEDDPGGEAGGGGQNKKFNENLSSTEPPKNVKGNPFGASCSDCELIVNPTKRVASCSFTDVIDEYDGCSSVSSLSQGALFSLADSSSNSQCSSRTITPNRDHMNHSEYSKSISTTSCDPSGYRKYYRLSANVDDTLVATCNAQCNASDVPLNTELLQDVHSEELLEADQNNRCSCSHESKARPSVTSACSSGLGSSLASTPTNSPVRPQLHSRSSAAFASPNSARLPFILLPPNIRAENSPASLNAIHCCTIM